MIKVLIIDDDDIVIFVQRKILERCEVCTNPVAFKNAFDALDFLTENQSAQDYLIFLDINMPKISGWQFLERLEKLKLTCKTFVVMVTSSIDSVDKKKSSEFSDIIHFIEKPINAKNCEDIKNLPELKPYFS